MTSILNNVYLMQNIKVKISMKDDQTIKQEIENKKAQNKVIVDTVLSAMKSSEPGKSLSEFDSYLIYVTIRIHHSDIFIDKEKVLPIRTDYMNLIRDLSETHGYTMEGLYCYFSHIFNYMIGVRAQYLTLFHGTDHEFTMIFDYYPILYTEMCLSTPKLTDKHFNTEDYLMLNNITVGDALFRYDIFLEDIKEESDDYQVVFNQRKIVEENMPKSECVKRYHDLRDLLDSHGNSYMPAIPSFEDASDLVKDKYWFVKSLHFTTARRQANN